MPLPESPALGHIEKTLADAYRKEIDQEENVWRTLPFFAATLALQLAALFQLADKLPSLDTALGKVAFGLLLASGGTTLLALGYLAAAIFPAAFRYVSREPALLEYARGLMADEAAAEAESPDSFSALVELKLSLCHQYANATDHNRQINKRREKRRSIAGLATIGSLFLMLFLVGTTFAHYLPAHAGPEANPSLSPSRPAARPGAPAPPGSADAGGHQGVVGQPRAGSAGGAVGAGRP